MDERLADILEQCLERLEQGATAEDCVARFPDQRADLEPALRAAIRMRALPRPTMPASTRAALEQSLLGMAARRRAALAPRSAAPPAQLVPSWRALGPEAILAGILRALGYRGRLAQPWLRLAGLGIAVVLALVLSAGALAAARAVVQIVRPQPTAVPTSSPATLQLDGRIEQIAQERWVVGGRAVTLTATTTISGTPALNAVAHVRGSAAPGGGLLAEKITVDPIPATPTAMPSATPAATEAATATTVPTALPAPTAPPDPPAPTVAPPARPTAAPAEAAPAPSNDNDQEHTCNGQQRGREDKKCDPKPHKNDGRDDRNDTHDKDKKDKKRG